MSRGVPERIASFFTVSISSASIASGSSRGVIFVFLLVHMQFLLPSRSIFLVDPSSSKATWKTKIKLSSSPPIVKQRLHVPVGQQILNGCKVIDPPQKAVPDNNISKYHRTE